MGGTDLIVAENKGVKVDQLAEGRGQGVEEELVVGQVELLEIRAIADLHGETVESIVVHV